MSNPSTDPSRIRRALLSVSDKTGLGELARALVSHGVEILSTGGTARLLREAGLAVTDVASVTGFPEMLDGRVKTLHPFIHAGLLARRGQDDATLAQHGIEPIDLLVVNLYPFEATIAHPDCSWATAVEQIDIGGPAMLRAAAKNHADVTVVVDPADYPELVAALTAGGTHVGQRRRLAVKAFAHTARYDGIVAGWLGATLAAEGGQSAALTVPGVVGYGAAESLRYGENPHQAAVLLSATPRAPGTVAGAECLAGKALSYNNLLDADAAWDGLRPFTEPACVIVKHANPCGVALASDALAAYRAAYATDPLSAFGGVIAFNRPLTAELLQAILEQQFAEVILAPEVTEAALTLATRKPDLRILACGPHQARATPELNWRSISGGLLLQQADLGDEPVAPGLTRVVTRRQPDTAEWADLRFAWRVCRAVKSNAIVYAAGLRTLGIGAGQSSRVDATRLAAIKAGERGLALVGAVMASDAFLPFRDGLDAAAAAGIRAVIQPGGSVRDPEVIAAADEHDIAMVFTGQRHFRH
ncbi:MAG TPA: bifunctional phosphoribosylaminoimidazolecarboxamide formyltransferase/inosine monophosphate cyclohydrolase [Gammaproteobacteria bacterium]|nr:bifunctional phosphoribosylaminoimidazolecarboxamide formyltransferase/inosine monophosphate cyclohydrolase [Gammaproteobacteria bacterium]